MSKVIPTRLQAEFMGWMDAHNDDDMPDGAWFATLEQAGQEFMEKHGLIRGTLDGNDAAHFYLQSAERREP